ncbi:diaminopimelate epimerase [Corynebacterium sp. A21]|uniref:diaminopimelate epimerase n=1 Tax=Corynebacterium sp. A21 TaxID=3457318 RepID=UPI003FD31180
MSRVNTTDPAQVPGILHFAKGHATENDFLIIEDAAGDTPLSPELIAALCDRRAGLGADGILRVIRAGALLDSGELAELGAGIHRADWFMDYRNADGSLAEMCGNGVRLFAHWLRSRGLVDVEDFTVGTRAGARAVKIYSWDPGAAEVSVDMGNAEVTGVSSAFFGQLKVAGLGVDLGNPHLAAVVPGLTPADLAQWDLVAPVFDEEFFPEGVNVEIVTELREGRVHMRVYERGVGETRSCGTGTVAAARAALADAGQLDGTVTVIVPGGRVRVEIAGEHSTLTGPSRILATGEVDTAALLR